MAGFDCYWRLILDDLVYPCFYDSQINQRNWLHGVTPANARAPPATWTPRCYAPLQPSTAGVSIRWGDSIGANLILEHIINLPNICMIGCSVMLWYRRPATDLIAFWKVCILISSTVTGLWLSVLSSSVLGTRSIPDHSKQSNTLICIVLVILFIRKEFSWTVAKRIITEHSTWDSSKARAPSGSQWWGSGSSDIIWWLSQLPIENFLQIFSFFIDWILRPNLTTAFNDRSSLFNKHFLTVQARFCTSWVPHAPILLKSWWANTWCSSQKASPEDVSGRFPPGYLFVPLCL